jgi:hypothetical protein
VLTACNALRIAFGAGQLRTALAAAAALAALGAVVRPAMWAAGA